MEGFERKPVRPNTEGAKTVHRDDQIFDSKRIAESTTDKRLREVHERNIDLLEDEKREVARAYRQRQSPEKRLEIIVNRMEFLKNSPEAGNEREIEQLRREYDDLLRTNAFGYVEDEPHLAVSKSADGVSETLKDARERIGHQPLRTKEQVEADRTEYLEKKREEYGYEGLRVSKPLPTEDKVEDPARAALSTHAGRAEINQKHEEMRLQALARAESAAYGEEEESGAAPQPKGFWGRIKRWFQRR